MDRQRGNGRGRGEIQKLLDIKKYNKISFKRKNIVNLFYF